MLRRDKIDDPRAGRCSTFRARQVLIESRIVIANEDFAREIGTKFGVSSTGTIGNTRVGQSGNNTGSRDAANGSTPALNDSYIVNLPSGTRCAVDRLVDPCTDLRSISSCRRCRPGRGEVISSPRVVTANGKQATIEQGREIPYQTSRHAGTNTQFKRSCCRRAGRRRSRRQSRDHGSNVTNDSQARTSAPAPAAPRRRSTRRPDTQVLIRSGDMVVLGGVFQRETNSRPEVLLLGDMPLLILFRKNSKEDTKRELLIRDAEGSAGRLGVE